MGHLKGWYHFYGGRWPLKTPCKDFNLAILGLGWMKLLKNGAEKCLYFMQLFWHSILLGENFIGQVRVLLYSIQYAWISIMKKKNSNQNEKIEKMVVLVKTFDHYHHKLKMQTLIVLGLLVLFSTGNTFFWVHLVQDLKIISFSWNFVRRLIPICRIPWWCSLFLLSTGNTFLSKFGPKIKIVRGEISH